MEPRLIYAGAAPLLLGLALRAWARWARAGGWTWFGLGVLLAAFGVDMTRQLLRRLADSPARGAAALVLALCALGLLAALRSVWATLGAPRGAAKPEDDTGSASAG